MNTARIVTALPWLAILCGVAAFGFLLLGESSPGSTVELMRRGALAVAPILGSLGLLLGRQYGKERPARVLTVLASLAVALAFILSRWS
jgi:hypothetical protein